jgi:hypothetical protein
MTKVEIKSRTLVFSIGETTNRAIASLSLPVM